MKKINQLDRKIDMLLVAVSVIAISLLLSCSTQPSGSQRKLDDKEVFQNRFPMTLSFRSDRYGLSQGYEFWENAHLPFHGITKKYLREEIDIDTVSAHLASQFSRNHPEKLMLIHLNGECTSAEDENTHKQFFPGHWVYMPGTTLLEDVDPSQKEIRVASAAPFSMEAFRIHGGQNAGQSLPCNLLLVRLDDDGNKLWHESEYAILEAVDHDNNTITLKRGQYFSTPISFASGKTYIAPVASDHWGGFIMWYYNLSTSCPLDQQGKSAADVWLEEIQRWFAPSGILKDIDGIGYDVLWFDKTTTQGGSVQQTWDLDNDGVPDGGVFNEKNLYRLGVWEFLKNLREAFGDEFLITADGWDDGMQRAVGVLNGMETEGLCRPNDGYRQVSRTINQHTYWNMYNNAKYSYSYITEKLRHPGDDSEELRWQLKRMGMGLACCLGVAYGMSPDIPKMLGPETFGGSLNTPGWLGKPLAEMIYVMENSTDLLDGNGKDMNSQLTGQFDFGGSAYRVENGELIISGNNPKPYANQEIKGPNISLPQGDLLVFVEARALDGFYDLEENTRVPRKFNVKLEGFLPDSEDTNERTRNFNNELAGYMGTPGYTPLSFYFRNQGRSSGTLRLIFEAEEQGGFAIRNLRVYNSPCLLAREFENGVVLVNTSLQPCSFDLKQLFPNTGQFRRLDVNKYNSDEAGKYMDAVSKHNDGSVEAGKAEVSGLNALFLLKTRSDQ